MRISKWVDFGAEVDIEIDFHDVRAALGEAMARVTEERFEEGFEEVPTRFDVARALDSIGTFFNALTDEQIGLLTDAQQKLCADFLEWNAGRFKLTTSKQEISG